MLCKFVQNRIVLILLCSCSHCASTKKSKIKSLVRYKWQTLHHLNAGNRTVSSTCRRWFTLYHLQHSAISHTSSQENGGTAPQNYQRGDRSALRSGKSLFQHLPLARGARNPRLKPLFGASESANDRWAAPPPFFPFPWHFNDCSWAHNATLTYIQWGWGGSTDPIGFHWVSL